MTTFTVTAAVNFDTLTSKAGDDAYNVNGGALTIDTDTRYCANSSATTGVLGDITISSSLGGSVLVDGTKVRLIAYNTGSGNVPAIGTAITQGGVTATLLGVWSALNAAPTTAGSAMPASGFIKVKNKTGGNYAAGALGGIGASATAADTTGWIEVIGVEARTCNVPRLGSFTVTGAWWDIGSSSGAANQTFQLPASLGNTYYPGVWIETASGSGVYEFWPSAGAKTDIATDIRGRFVWISSQGLLRVGHNGTANAGRVPASGCKIRVPNVVFINTNSTAGFGANVVPSTSPGTRYDFTTTAGGTISITRACMAWYLSCVSPYAVTLTEFAAMDCTLFQTVATRLSFTHFGVGITSSWFVGTATAVLLNECRNGADFVDCALTSPDGFGYALVSATDCNDMDFVRPFFAFAANSTNGGSAGITLQRCADVTTDGMQMIGLTAVDIRLSSRLAFKNTRYASVISGASLNSGYTFALSTKSSDVTVDGVDFFGLTNVHPHTGIVFTAGGGNGNFDNVVFRNAGTRAAPLPCGTVNPMQSAFTPTPGSGCKGVKVQRVFLSGSPRFNEGVVAQFNGYVNEAEIEVQNAGLVDYAYQTTIFGFNCTGKGVHGGVSLLTVAAQYGTHFFDAFYSATTGRIIAVMNEKTTQEPSASTYQILAGTPRFTGAGRLIMAAVGDSIEYTMPYYALGHTGFANAGLTIDDGDPAKYTIQYQLDKNDGAGFGTLKTLNGTNLSGETGISASLGIKLRIRLTTITANTDAFRDFYVQTTSTSAAQDFQYPLDSLSVTLTNVVVGSTYRLEKVSDGTLIASGTAGSSTVSLSVDGSLLGIAVRVKIRKASTAPKYVAFTTQIAALATTQSVFVSQALDPIA